MAKITITYDNAKEEAVGKDYLSQFGERNLEAIVTEILAEHAATMWKHRMTLLRDEALKNPALKAALDQLIDNTIPSKE